METSALALRPASPALGSAVLGLASAGAVLILCAGFSGPPWAFMWAMAFALFAAAKWFTCRNAMARAVRTTPLRVAAYWLAWPGMDAAEFLNREAPLPKACVGDALAGLAKLAAGAALIWMGVDWVYGRSPLLAGWTGMAGIVLVLHFGLFQILAWAWQALGVPAQPIMRAPLRATGLSEFWGRRWNAAFNTLAYDLVFRPLRFRYGAAVATMASFLISGLVHECVISVPARGGYGLPTVYFLLQGAGLWLERSRAGKRLGLTRGWRGWLFTLCVTAGPAYWLFHPPFVEAVVLPFLQVIGALNVHAPQLSL